MSQESMIWLNSQTLIGNTLQRGNAWHYREDLQGVEPNHYEGFIPVEDVTRRLFNFSMIEAAQTYIVAGEIENAIITFERDGETFSVVSSQAGRKGMLRSTRSTIWDHLKMATLATVTRSGC